jgi:hypothetical protein
MKSSLLKKRKLELLAVALAAATLVQKSSAGSNDIDQLYEAVSRDCMSDPETNKTTFFQRLFTEKISIECKKIAALRVNLYLDKSYFNGDNGDNSYRNVFESMASKALKDKGNNPDFSGSLHLLSAGSDKSTETQKIKIETVKGFVSVESVER